MEQKDNMVLRPMKSLTHFSADEEASVGYRYYNAQATQHLNDCGAVIHFVKQSVCMKLCSLCNFDHNTFA